MAPLRCVGLLLAVGLVVTTSLASACPSCPVGKAARQEVLDQDFGANLVISVAPFLVVGLIARRAERIRDE